MMEKVKRVGPHQKVDGVVDEEVDESEEERGVLVVDVELGRLSQVQKPEEWTNKNFWKLTSC